MQLDSKNVNDSSNQIDPDDNVNMQNTTNLKIKATKKPTKKSKIKSETEN